MIYDQSLEYAQARHGGKGSRSAVDRKEKRVRFEREVNIGKVSNRDVVKLGKGPKDVVIKMNGAEDDYEKTGDDFYGTNMQILSEIVGNRGSELVQERRKEKYSDDIVVEERDPSGRRQLIYYAPPPPPQTAPPKAPKQSLVLKEWRVKSSPPPKDDLRRALLLKLASRQPLAAGYNIPLRGGRF